MFTQAISMNCTKQQYEKYLKDELLKMGYNGAYITFWESEDIIVNNASGDMGDLGSLFSNSRLAYGRTYLGSFNAPLFLALAAMREGKFLGYGQYVTRESDGALIRNKGLGQYFNSRGYHISTKEEIMAKFGKDKAVSTIIAIDITTNSDEKRCDCGSEEQMIAILKSKGYKILKPTTWEEV